MSKITIEIDRDELANRLFKLAAAGEAISALGFDDETVIEYVASLSDNLVETLILDPDFHPPLLPPVPAKSEPKPIGYTVRNIPNNVLPSARVFSTVVEANNWIKGLDATQYDVIAVHEVPAK